VAYALFLHGRNWKQLCSQQGRLFVKAGLLTSCLYLPWLLWAWGYYGSPIPNTIVAKGLDRHHIEMSAYLRAAVAFPIKILYEITSAQITFAPANPNYGPWPEMVRPFWRWVPLLPACYWVLPGGHPLARACSAAFVVGHYYLSRISPVAFSWYLPPVALLALLPWADAIHRFWNWLARRRVKTESLAQLVVKAAVIVLVTAQLATTLIVAEQMRTQQQVVENGLRKRLGLWLRENAASRADTVFIECLGYVGYFSQLKMLDWPGLSSPEVIAARRQTGYRGYMDLRLLATLQPDWVVLRPSEFGPELANPDSFLVNHYKVVKVFDVSEEVKKNPLRYGRKYLEFDQSFTVFKRIKPPGNEPALPVPSL
jgi:hypothetical protein